MTLTWTLEEVVTDQCVRLPAWAGLGRSVCGGDLGVWQNSSRLIHTGAEVLRADMCFQQFTSAVGVRGVLSAQAGGGQRC